MKAFLMPLSFLGKSLWKQAHVCKAHVQHWRVTHKVIHGIMSWVFQRLAVKECIVVVCKVN